MGVLVCAETKSNIVEGRMFGFVRSWLLVQIPQREAKCAKHIWSVAICIFIFIFRETCADLYLKTNQSSVSFQALQSFVAPPSQVLQSSRKLQEVQPNLSVFHDFYSFDCNLQQFEAWCIAYDCKPAEKMLCK